MTTTNQSSQVAALFGVPKAVVGIVHVGALPGTPFARRSVSAIVEQAVREAELLAGAGFNAVLIENTHDRPYLRRLVLPRPMKTWSMTTLREKLIKIGAKAVHHARYVIFQMAEAAVPRKLFAAILDRIQRLRAVGSLAPS